MPVGDVMTRLRSPCITSAFMQMLCAVIVDEWKKISVLPPPTGSFSVVLLRCRTVSVLESALELTTSALGSADADVATDSAVDSWDVCRPLSAVGETLLSIKTPVSRPRQHCCRDDAPPLDSADPGDSSLFASTMSFPRA